MFYIEPRNPPSEEPIIDGLTMKMVAALRKATLPHRQSLGFHTCVCGAKSDSTDFILPNGLRTNSLCVHYLAYHRAEIEDGELWAVDGLADGFEYPNSHELHGGSLPCAIGMGARSGPPRRSTDVERGTTRESETRPSRAVSPGCCGGLARVRGAR